MNNFLKVTYKATSMEALADHLDGMADEKRQEAASITHKGAASSVRSEAIGIETAARIVRNTTIDPSMKDNDDAQAEE